MKKALQNLFALALVGVTVWGIVISLQAFASYLRSLDTDTAKAIVAASAALLGSAFTIVVGKSIETRAATVRDLRIRKIPIYEQIVKELFRVVFAKILNEPMPTQPELLRFFAQTTETLTIWGSNDVVRAFGRFKTSGDPKETVFLVEELMFAIRKDLGHGVNLERGEILRLFITNFDKEMSD